MKPSQIQSLANSLEKTAVLYYGQLHYTASSVNCSVNRKHIHLPLYLHCCLSSACQREKNCGARTLLTFLASSNDKSSFPSIVVLGNLCGTDKAKQSSFEEIIGTLRANWPNLAQIIRIASRSNRSLKFLISFACCHGYESLCSRDLPQHAICHFFIVILLLFINYDR